jgi:hypothetical protein
MFKRYIPVAALAACLLSASAPAFATDDPPPASPPPATAPAAPAAPEPAATPTAPGCSDLTKPRSRVATTSRTASRRHMLRGTALDGGCTGSSVALVTVAVELRHGKKCQFLKANGKLSKAGSCSRTSWLAAKGTKQWSLRLPKTLKRGSYQILTRAVDAAGNVERAHARRLAISRPPSTKTK